MYRENIGNMADLEAELVHARDIAAKEFFVAEVNYYFINT